ncbi:hypothetical protein N665_0218s0110 [Sinapis alba]|nr:hypothetical protein N665_0218s0110 [Sinapis alba]
MPLRKRLTREQKGKEPVFSRLFRGEPDGDSIESKLRDSEGNSTDAGTSGPDFYPTRYSPDRFFEKLPAIPPELWRPPIVEVQEWSKVRDTESTPGSVQKLLRDCGARGVTFLVPTYEERPWSPPVGYQCVYESYFQPDTKLDVALSQFVNGSYRIAVALMVLAAEIDVSINICAFEELTCLKQNLMTQGWNHHYFFIKSNKAVFDDPPREDFRVLWNFRIVDHPNVLDYPDGLFDNAQAVAALSHQRWPDINKERIRRALAQISRLFSKKEKAYIKRSKKMKELPDLSALLGDELDLVGSNPMSILDGMDLGGGADFGGSGSSGLLSDPLAEVCAGPVEEGNPLETETARPKGQGKKRSRSKRYNPDIGKESEDVYTEQRPKKKKKKNKSTEKVQGDFVSGKESIALSEGGPRGVHLCADLVRQVRSGPESLPHVEDLMFREAYARDVHARLVDREIVRREVRKRKMEEMGAELASICSAATELEQKNAALEREKAALEKEKADIEQEKSVTALRFLKETTRLKESRSFGEELRKLSS